MCRRVVGSYVTLPDLPGIGFEGKADLYREMKALSDYGLLTLWTRTRCTAESAQRKAPRRRRVGHPASLCNAAIGVFGSNPKGTGALGRHPALFSSRRRPVFASSAALIGAAGHPFASVA